MFALEQVKAFLVNAIRGDASLSDEIMEEFTRDCKEAIEKQFKKEGNEWRIRMSGLGKPLCQQMLERDGHEEERDYNLLLRFFIGDLVEAAVMAVLKGAGVKIVDSQTQCNLTLADTDVRGTLDVIIDDPVDGKKVWDIKSASPYSFSQKFGKGYEGIKEDDPFGYVMQGHLYAEANDLPFGGWIVVDKSSGGIIFVEAPDNQQEDRDEYLKEAEGRVKALKGNVPFKKAFKAEPETYRRDGEQKETGNTLLPKLCSMCGHRSHCWPKAVLHPKVTSKARIPPMAWYDKIKVKSL